MRGAYHFFRPKYDGVAQAKHFVATMGTLADDDLPPVCDLEVQDGVSDATVIARTKDFLETMEKLSGKKPMIYTGYFFTSLGSPSGFSSYPLWVAELGRLLSEHPQRRLEELDLLAEHRQGQRRRASVARSTATSTTARCRISLAFAKGPDKAVNGSFDKAKCTRSPAGHGTPTLRARPLGPDLRR